MNGDMMAGGGGAPAADAGAGGDTVVIEIPKDKFDAVSGAVAGLNEAFQAAGAKASEDIAKQKVGATAPDKGGDMTPEQKALQQEIMAQGGAPA